MRHVFYIGLFLASLFLGSCNKADLYEEKAKSIDSLIGAVNSVAMEIKNIDTLALQKSITRFNWYRQFIEEHINDTIHKSEADNLQHFYAGGKKLEDFSSNRKLILVRAALVNDQMQKLSADIKNKTLTTDQVLRYFLHEKNEASKLIEARFQQQKIFHSGLEEFKNSLGGVELLIKTRNKGELPTIIKDTVSL